MAETNLAGKLEAVLPEELASFVETAGKLASKREQGFYLVGGIVRDLLLGKPNLDLDLAVEGDAIELARVLVQMTPVKITVHSRFGTAKLTFGNWSVDIATARSETYERPGALPTVTPSSIKSDLFRRDFTINAMAICLNTDRYGELLDHYGGQNDLEHKLIRILHERSFIDDATRIWRGLRYEQRLDFRLEETTLKLLRRDIPMLDTISGDRIRYELECIFAEEQPEKVLIRAEELGVLKKLHPALKADRWLTDKFKSARRLAEPNPPPFSLYLALLAYRLKEEEYRQLISYLRMPKSVTKVLEDTIAIKATLKRLTYPELRPSYIHRLLHGFSPSAILAASIATASPIAHQHLEVYLHKLRYVKSALRGDDLLSMGVSPGPQVREILKRLHDARLDGKVTTKQGEEELAREWLNKDVI